MVSNGHFTHENVLYSIGRLLVERSFQAIGSMHVAI